MRLGGPPSNTITLAESGLQQRIFGGHRYSDHSREEPTFRWMSGQVGAQERPHTHAREQPRCLPSAVGPCQSLQQGSSDFLEFLR